MSCFKLQLMYNYPVKLFRKYGRSSGVPDLVPDDKCSGNWGQLE